MPSRELLARLSPQTLIGPFAAHQPSQRLSQQPQQHLIVAKDFSRTGGSHPSDAKDSQNATRLSPARLGELRRELLQQRQDEERAETTTATTVIRDERMTGGGRSSPISPASLRPVREFDERSADSAERSLEGADDHLLDDDQEVRSDDEDLNVMDSDECSNDKRPEKEEKSSPVVPQPIHPGVQRSSGPYMSAGGPGSWTSPGFPHSLASFAWLPPPPHPHNPHSLYNPHGGPTSPNGKGAAALFVFSRSYGLQRVCYVGILEGSSLKRGEKR